MTESNANPPTPLRIKTPCPKTWDELQGGDKQRFCSECSLHVLNAARLTSAQARDLVAGASGRVCMRVEYSASGQPIFADSPRPQAVSPLRRLARWSLSAAAGILAACHGSVSEVTPSGQAAGAAATSGNGAEETNQCGPANALVMGKVASSYVELGDVAVPPAPAQAPIEGVGLVRLGEMESMPSQPTTGQAPKE